MHINNCEYKSLILSVSNGLREVGALPEDPSREGCGIGNPEKSDATGR